jgi:energy-converting hydrogenase A subunit R
MANVICFDLEGPLSPQDNAYEVMGLFREGHKVFEVLSRYDDILTLEGREGYEPGDTLSLIIPFLVYNRVCEEDIRKVSDSAKIVDGVPYTIQRLKELGWDPYIISTSYQQHAYNIGSKVGVPEEKVYCTKLALDAHVKCMPSRDSAVIEKAEKDILNDLYQKRR